MNPLPFVFAGNAGHATTGDDFVLAVPAGIQSTDRLFSCYAKEGRFPGYFGENWNALLDCLRDFSWIDKRRIVILHQDQPLSNSRDDLRTYLEILGTAVNDWKEVKEGPFVEPPEHMPYVEHELVVVFPASFERAIRHALAR